MKSLAIALFNAGNRTYGLGEFEYSLGSRIARRRKELESHGIRLTMLVNPDDVGLFGDDVEYMAISRKERKEANSWRGRLSRKRILDGFDLVHLTNQRPSIKRPGCKILMTVHDLNFLHNRISPIRRWRKRLRTRRDIARADALVYISQFTRTDVERTYHPHVPDRVIYNGATDLSDAPQAAVEGLPPENFLLHISRMGPKKNVHLLVEMMKHLPEEHLVIMGSAHKSYRRRLEKIVEREGLTNVHFAGRVSDAEKTWGLTHCRGLLFPSMSEGFGLPVVEAMYCGKPVFLAPYTSLPEVGGGEAYYFTKLEPEEMARTVKKGLADMAAQPEKASRLRNHAQKFSWDRAADEYISLYIDLLGE